MHAETRTCISISIAINDDHDHTRNIIYIFITLPPARPLQFDGQLSFR